MYILTYIVYIHIIYTHTYNVLIYIYVCKISLKKAQEELKERCKFPLEDRLRLNIVGQEGPITAVAAGM